MQWRSLLFFNCAKVKTTSTPCLLSSADDFLQSEGQHILNPSNGHEEVPSP